MFGSGFVACAYPTCLGRRPWRNVVCQARPARLEHLGRSGSGPPNMEDPGDKMIWDALRVKLVYGRFSCLTMKFSNGRQSSS